MRRPAAGNGAGFARGAAPSRSDESLEYGPPVRGALSSGRERGPLASVRRLWLEVGRELQRSGWLPALSLGLRGSAALVPWRFWRFQADMVLATRSLEVDEFGFDPKFSAIFEPVLEFLYSRYWRVESLGLSNVPGQGRALLVANHAGTLPFDAAMIAYAVHRDHASHRLVRPLLEDFAFHFPYVGPTINRLGAVRACQENARRVLESGQLALVFPEGIQGMGKLYSQRYRLGRFGRGGFIKLALRTRTPIVPVAVVGSEEIYPMVTKVVGPARSVGLPFLPVTPLFPWLGPAGLVPLPSKWVIRFGAPMRLHETHGPEAAEDRLLVNQLTELVRNQVGRLLEEARAERAGVFKSL